MSARYFTMVENGLMEHIRQPGTLPAELRLVAEHGPVDNGAGEWTLVEFEDDGAPEWMAGRLVTPTITRTLGRQHQDGPAEPERRWVSNRYVEDQTRVIMLPTTSVAFNLSRESNPASTERTTDE